MRRGTQWLVVAVLSGLALAACTGDPEDPPTTTPATSAAPSPSEIPTPTPTPDAATPPERPDMSRVDVATAEAVARYFLGLYGYAYATGDTSGWRALSHPDCIFCADLTADVDRSTAAGETVEGGGISATESNVTEITGGSWYSVEVSATQTPWLSRAADGTVIEASDTPTTHIFTVVVIRENGQWFVRGVQVDDAPA